MLEGDTFYEKNRACAKESNIHQGHEATITQLQSDLLEFSIEFFAVFLDISSSMVKPKSSSKIPDTFMLYMLMFWITKYIWNNRPDFQLSLLNFP